MDKFSAIIFVKNKTGQLMDITDHYAGIMDLQGKKKLLGLQNKKSAENKSLYISFRKIQNL